MKIGYIRYKFDNLNLQKQIKKLEDYGCTKIIIGTKTDNKVSELKALIKNNDLLVVLSLTLFANSVSSLLRLIDFCMVNELKVHCIEEDIEIPEDQNCFKYLIEFDKKIMLERSAQALSIAKKGGKTGGRKKISQEKIAAIKELSKTTRSVSEICQELEISRSTYYKYYNFTGSSDSSV